MGDRERDRAPDAADPNWAADTYKYARSTWTDQERAQEDAQKRTQKAKDEAPIYNPDKPYKKNWTWDTQAEMWVPPTSSSSSNPPPKSYQEEEGDLLAYSEMHTKFAQRSRKYDEVDQARFLSRLRMAKDDHYQKLIGDAGPTIEGDIQFAWVPTRRGTERVTFVRRHDPYSNKLYWEILGSRVSTGFNDDYAKAGAVAHPTSGSFLQTLPRELKEKVIQYL